MAERSKLPHEFYKKFQVPEMRAVSGAALGAIGAVYVVDGDKNRLKPRRTAIIAMLGAAAGYIAGPLMPSIENIENKP